MKKYNVFELWVVKVDDYYFICEKSFDDKTYSEIFTKEKIKMLDSQKIEPLKNYYSLLAIMNYTTRESLMLIKKELLIKYAEMNSSHIERKKQHNSNYETFIKEQEECKKALKELTKELNNVSNSLKQSREAIENANEEAIANLQRTGIIDEKGELAAPYDTLSGDESEKYIPTEHGRVLIKKKDRN